MQQDRTWMPHTTPHWNGQHDCQSGSGRKDAAESAPLCYALTDRMKAPNNILNILHPLVLEGFPQIEMTKWFMLNVAPKAKFDYSGERNQFGLCKLTGHSRGEHNLNIFFQNFSD